MVEVAPSPTSYGSVSVILPLLEYLWTKGLDPGPILGRAGIDQSAIEDTKARLPKAMTKESRGIDEVGFLLGFSDQSAFTKAFRRWTGKTPADFVRTSSL